MSGEYLNKISIWDSVDDVIIMRRNGQKYNIVGNINISLSFFNGSKKKCCEAR